MARDRAETLIFFVLENVCRDLASALEAEAVSVDRFNELTAGIAGQIGDLLRDIQQGRPDLSKLELLVSSLFRNLGMYRH
ncbi:MAG TPA: hypothetical protein VH207_10645 [Chthoniobacterales bacterium]|nr:hypothetical protein [Chthoniobacterales bacterium]